MQISFSWQLLKQGGTNLLEPVVVLEVVTDTDYLSHVMADLSNRRANIQGINDRKKQRVILYI
jgi:elongation factor G